MYFDRGDTVIGHAVLSVPSRILFYHRQYRARHLRSALLMHMAYENRQERPDHGEERVGEREWLASACPFARLHSSALPPPAFIKGLLSWVGKTNAATHIFA